MEKCFVVTAPGIEAVTAGEMRQIGLLPAAPAGDWGLSGEEGGGVSFEGNLEAICRANLHLRTASRVLVRLGDFYASGFPELRKKAGRLAWERFIIPGQAVTLHVTCHKSKLYHSGAVAERVAAAISERIDGELRVVKAAESDPTDPPQLIVVRFSNDHCTISIDSSGELLHRRGYRLETAKAPLRESLAAALVLASGWDQTSPLLDPFCGSGTIAIEAALLASGRPSGMDRRFAFERWPGFPVERWQQMRTEAKTGTGAIKMPVIQASDRDEGAIRVARSNAERAGVGDWIEFTHRAVSAIEPPSQSGWVVTNPPYGLRVSANKDVRNLYAQFGHVLRAKCPGWFVNVLSSDMKLLGQMGMKLEPALSTVNGGIAVMMGRGQVSN